MKMIDINELSETVKEEAFKKMVNCEETIMTPNFKYILGMFENLFIQIFELKAQVRDVQRVLEEMNRNE